MDLRPVTAIVDLMERDETLSDVDRVELCDSFIGRIDDTIATVVLHSGELLELTKIRRRVVSFRERIGDAI